VKRSRVFVTKILNKDLYEPLVRLTGYLNLPAKAASVGIKLNLCDYRKYETGVTTDPRVLDALLDILRKKYPNAKIYLFENDATGTLTDNLFSYLGLDIVAKKYDVQCLNLQHCDWIAKSINGCHFNHVMVPKLLQETDILINHPKLKTHGRTKITCGLKNMFGCYQIKDKVCYHKFLDEAIVDINIAVKTHVTIVDGYLGLEGNRGPTQGYPKRVGLFFGGTDPVAVDSFCARLMGFVPFFVGHIRKSWRSNLGNMRYQILGDLKQNDLKKYRFKFSLGKYLLMQTARKLLK
jgi:uncharacterized protein (DUF362 family)